MSTVKLKELKDDAIVSIQVNKTYYLMVKNLLFNLFKDLQAENPALNVKELTEKAYDKMTESERSFYTVTLLLAEIEKQATDNKLFTEQEISEEELKKTIENLDGETTN